MSKSSVVHGKANVEKLERHARELLGIPALPDGATGPRSAALLAQIQADERTLGKAAALAKWAHVSTVAHAIALDDDPPEHRAASGRGVASLEHPTNKGTYHYPHSAALERALTNPVARSKCSATALAALDAHKAGLADPPDEWKPKGKQP